MGKTSNKVKQQWNSQHYTQIKVSVKPDVALLFKSLCKKENVSMANELTGFMIKRCGNATPDKNKKDLSGTRGGRRKLLDSVIEQLEQIKTGEEQYRDNFPVNLQSSEKYDSAEQSISDIEDAIDILNEVFK